MNCPACGSSELRAVASTPRVVVRRCSRCAHRVASHSGRPPSADYHQQYEQDAFLDALAGTRRRQARTVLELIRRHARDPGRLLDFGAGRGWFLDACRAAGVDPLAGADTSELAVRSLAERGFEAVLLEPPGAGEWSPDLRGLGFRPRVATLIHVVEHFEAERCVEMLRAVVAAMLPELEALVMMVPLSSGILYRTAAALARAGVPGPYEQLYQVGTHPPHFSYFSERSMRVLLDRVGLDVLAVDSDPDFEPASLRDRAAALDRLPRSAVLGAGWAARAAATGLRMEDCGIFVAAPRRGDRGAAPGGRSH